MIVKSDTLFTTAPANCMSHNHLCQSVDLCFGVCTICCRILSVVAPGTKPMIGMGTRHAAVYCIAQGTGGQAADFVNPAAGPQQQQGGAAAAGGGGNGANADDDDDEVVEVPRVVYKQCPMTCSNPR